MIDSSERDAVMRVAAALAAGWTATTHPANLGAKVIVTKAIEIVEEVNKRVPVHVI